MQRYTFKDNFKINFQKKIIIVYIWFIIKAYFISFKQKTLLPYYNAILISLYLFKIYSSLPYYESHLEQPGYCAKR